MTFDFTFTGQTALILHADDVMKADVVSAERDRIKKAKEPFKAADDRFPAWTWMTYVYDDGEYLAMPSENIMKCFLKAAATFPKQGKKGTYKSESQVAIFILDEFCKFSVPSGPIPKSALDKIKPLTFSKMADRARDLGIELLTKRVAVERKKHVRVRPRFDEWAVRGRIELDEAIIPPDIFAEILDYAGNRVGLGDWRPSAPISPGPYGRFLAELKKAG